MGERFTAQTTRILVLMPLVLVMTVLVAVVHVMPGVSFLFNKNSPSSFDVVWTACLELNKYPWRCGQVAINLDINVGSTWQAWRCRQAWWNGKPGFGLCDSAGDGDGCD